MRFFNSQNSTKILSKKTPDFYTWFKYVVAKFRFHIELVAKFG